ncbi:MAG: helicase, partial [Ignavibacteria bacterium]|nr:helicase [Ignavibacteria bacterium]
MGKTSDLTFIINESEQNLKQRFEVLINDSRFFDCLVGYFYISGFHSIFKALEKNEKIRILVGMNMNRTIYDLWKSTNQEEQTSLQFSHAEIKNELDGILEKEMENSEDNQ